MTRLERMCVLQRMADYRVARWHKRYETACWNRHLKEYREANWKGVADYLWTFHVWNESVKHVSEYWYPFRHSIAVRASNMAKKSPVPTVRFEAWDELNRPIPPHTPFKLTKEKCYRNPRLMQDPLLLYCPLKEIAIRLDPEDPWDRRLLDAYNNKKPKIKEAI